MTGEVDPAVAALLTPQEIETVQFAQVFYGARVKGAAAELSETLGLDEEARQQLIGRMALGVEGLDAVQRQEIAGHLFRISALLSAVGDRALSETAIVGSAIAPDSAPALELLHVANGNGHNGYAPTESIEEPDSQPTTVEDSPGPMAGEDDKGHTKEPSGEPVSAGSPLSAPQRHWLAKVLGEKNVDQIEELPVYQRLDFAAKLGERYCDLKIPRLNTESKRQRTEQLMAFIGGKPYKEIAALHSTSYEALAMGIKKMAESITKRIPQEDLLALIPKQKLSRPLSANPAREQSESDEPVALLPHQQKWLLKVFHAENVNQVSGYTDAQREVLAEVLSRYLSAFLIKRDGKVKTDRRVNQMALLAQGKTYEEIAEAVSQPVDVVKKELHNSAGSLKNRLKAWDIKRIFEQARSGQVQPVR